MEETLYDVFDETRIGMYPHSVIHTYFCHHIYSSFTLPPSSGRSGLVGHAGVALVGGSIGDFQLHARLLLIHQHLSW